MIIKTYSELIKLPTFEERFRYLQLNGTVCKETFGYDRYINQLFYKKSPEWRAARRAVIIRDCGLDLGVDGYVISGKVFVHHMNPVSLDDIVEKSEFLLNPEYLITTSFNTHNAIHYGDESLLITSPIERTKNDTCPWRQ